MDGVLNNIVLLNELFSLYGTKEISGPVHNDVILDLFKDAGFAGVKNDETSWCAATILACAKRTGYDVKGANLTARSFLKCGIEVTEPQLGDVVVLWRGSKDSWQGHVGAFIRRDGEILYLLGGNQGNTISIAPYNINRLLAYRRLQPED